MALNKHINEAYPAFVGGGNAVQNGKTNTQPSSDMVSPQNIENSTLGGSEAVVSDTRHMFDFVNGKGDYGVFGRDFSYSISSLALVNPYAAGAVVGVLGAGSLIYGIMTSAYVRSKQTLRRLRAIYRGVIGKGYRVDNLNSLYLGALFNAFTGLVFRKETYNRLGVNQFYEEIVATIEGIMDAAGGLKLGTPSLIENLTPGEYKKKRSGINHILSTSYTEFYIPSAEVEGASERYNDILKSNRFKYDKNIEESYDKLMKRMQESTVNSPLYKRRDDYVAKINELGESLVAAFDTKMGYALKRGGNRAVSCSKKLHSTWKGMMDDIKKKIDAKLDIIVQETGTTKAQEARDIIEAMYKKNALPLTIERVQNQLYVGALFMRRSSVAKEGNPEMVKICSFNADDWDDGLVRIKLVNSDIAGKGRYTKVPITKLYDATDMPTEVDKRDDNSGKGRNNDRYIRLGEYKFDGTVKEGRWYKVNYIASTGGTAGANGMWTAVVYVVGIVTAGAYGAPGAKYVQYRYVNFPTYVGKKGGGTLQQEPLDSFSAWIISEIKEFNHINKIVESNNYNSGADYLFEESDEDNDIKIINPNPAPKYEPWRRRPRVGANSNSSNNSNGGNSTSSTNTSSTSFSADDDGEYIDSLSDCKIDCTSFAFARKGAYILYASKNREIVYTEDITPGKVRIYNAYENKKEFSWKEWEELIPVQVPFARNPYGDPDIADILLDDDIEDINNGDDYPLKYGTFEKTYVQRKFEMQYNSVFSKYDASLREIDITLDDSGKRCFGLCKADGYYGKNTLRDPENFKRYLRECISDEILIKDETEMNSILGNNKSSSNESLSIKGIKRLFESGVLFEDSPVQNNTKVEDKSMKQNTKVVNTDVSAKIDGSKNNAALRAGSGSAQAGRDFLGKIENLYGNKLDINGGTVTFNVYIQSDGNQANVKDIVAEQQQTGKVGQNPEKTADDIKKKGEKGKGGSEDTSTNDDNKKQIVPIDGIPDIVRKVCIDILRKVKAFAKQFSDGNDRTKFNNPPRVFRGRTDQIVHLLTWHESKRNELGVDNLDDISKHDFSKDVVSSLATPNWHEKYIVGKEYKDKWEPIFYYKKEEVVPKHKPDEIYIDTDDSDNGEENRVMTYTFFIRDKFVEVTDIEKFDETFTLTADGVYMKGSDQEHKKDLDNANVSLGGYYLLSSDIFKSLHEKEETTEENRSNESYDYSDKEFYKIFEDDNNDSAEDDEIHLDNDDDSDTETSSKEGTTSSDSGKDVLVLVNAVKDGKVEFKYIKDSSLVTDYVSVDRTAKVDMNRYAYEYATDDKMKIQYYSVYQLSKEGYDFIANAGFIKDRSSVSMYTNDTVLVIPTLPVTTPTIEPMKVGVIDFIIGNTATEALPVLYEYALMHDFDNALTYVDWMSKISYGLFKTGDASQYYKMSKDDFDKSFGLLIKQEEPDNKEQEDNSVDNKEENTAQQQEQVNSGYYYDVDYFYKLYEADDNSTTEDNAGSEEQHNTEDSSADVKEVYIEITPVSGSYKSMDSTTTFGAKFIAKCKTDVQLKEGGEAKETTEFLFNEQKLQTDIKMERLDDMPEGWDKKPEDNKGEEEKKDDNKDVKYEPYPDRGVSPIDKNSYDGLETLKKWITTIDLENKGSKLDSYSRGMMIDFIVSTFKKEVNESSRFDGLGSIMKSLLAKTVEPNRFDNDIEANKYDVMYDFVIFIIDMFLADGWNSVIGVKDESPQWLHYINAEGKEVQHEVKVENVTDSSIYILYKDGDEGDKHYILPKKGNEYMIIESAFGFPTIRFKSHEMYMKHVLYNVPLNEALIVDFGGMDSFKSILNMLVNDDDSLYSIMSWAMTNGAYKTLVERYNKIHANDGNTTQTQQSQSVQPQSPAQNTPKAQPNTQVQSNPQAQPKPVQSAHSAPQGTNPTATGAAPTWTTTSTAEV